MPLPTPGRIVWYYPSKHIDDIPQNLNEPLAAIVAAVYAAGTRVNLHVIDADGESVARRSILFVQPNEAVDSASGCYATWMPYQVGQAAKTEALQAELTKKFPTRAGG